MILDIKDLVKAFVVVRAVDHVTFGVNEGEFVGLIGPNGSGKTTLFNVISGVYPPDSGTVYLDGGRIDNLRPDEIFKRGLVRTFQISRPFHGMTLLENMLVPPRNQLGEKIMTAPIHSKWRSQEIRLALKSLGLLQRGRIAPLARNLAIELSSGQMKIADLVRGLMGEPRVFLLDEPSAGLAPDLARQIFEDISQVNAEFGTTFLVIEHRIKVLFNYVKRVLVMNNGAIVADGCPEEILENEEVMNAYLGSYS